MEIIVKFKQTLIIYFLSCMSFAAVLGILYLADVIPILRFIALAYYAGLLVIPVILALIGFYQIFRTKNRLPKDGLIKGLFSLFCLAMFVYGSFVEPQNLQVERRSFSLPQVTETFTLLHISDIQSNQVGNYEKKVFEIIDKISADIILLTGDLVQPFYFWGYESKRYVVELSNLSVLFRKLQPEYGIYNVIGDTEATKKIPLFDELSGVTTLQNENVLISTPKGILNILGLTLATSRHCDMTLINKWIKKGDHRHIRIVMGHAPDFIKQLLDSQVDVCLAGHTHGGQINIPFIGPLLTSSSIPKSWVRGFKHIQSLYFNVSAGIGVSHAWGLPPIRFRCPPVITVIQIKPEEKAITGNMAITSNNKMNNPDF